MNNIKLSKSKEIKLKRSVKVKCIYASDNINNYIKNNQSNKTKSNGSNNNTKQTSKISSNISKSVFKNNNTLYKKNKNIESKTKIINVLWTKNLKKINNNKKIYKKYNKKNFNNFKNQSSTTSSDYVNSNFLNYELGENKNEYEEDVFSNSQFKSIINQLDDNNKNQNKYSNYNYKYFNNFDINNNDNNKEIEFNLSKCDFIDDSLLLPKKNIEIVSIKKKIKRMKSNSLLENSNSNYILNTEEFNENERNLPKYIINNYRNFKFYKVLKTSDF